MFPPPVCQVHTLMRHVSPASSASESWNRNGVLQYWHDAVDVESFLLPTISETIIRRHAALGTSFTAPVVACNVQQQFRLPWSFLGPARNIDVLT